MNTNVSSQMLRGIEFLNGIYPEHLDNLAKISQIRQF